MRSDVQQIIDTLKSMDEKLGVIQNSISGSEGTDKSTKEESQPDHVINEVDIMNRLLIKILGTLNKVSFVELSFTHNGTYSSFDRELLAVISF